MICDFDHVFPGQLQTPLLAYNSLAISVRQPDLQHVILAHLTNREKWFISTTKEISKGDFNKRRRQATKLTSSLSL